MITFFRWGALLTLVYWLAAYWQLGRKIVLDIQQSIRSANSRLDTALMLGMTLGAFLLLINAFIITFRGEIIQGNWFLALSGCVMVMVGVAGMFHCRTVLGRFWTAETSLRKEHQVVENGPYRMVRHPIYSFAILMYAGLGILFLAWWNLLLAGVMILGYVLKSSVEDQFLEKNLPGYHEYRQRVRWRILPGVW
jgi:protein-S-isoprenylcysteine O-methyltransferase Ste14